VPHRRNPANLYEPTELTEVELYYPDPPATHNLYTTRPTHVRVYHCYYPDDPQWHLDGITKEGLFTRAVWHFETKAEALAARAQFIREHFA
jgi:hypothetical protein